MLHLNHSHHLHLPHMASLRSPMALSPVVSEPDELIQDIEQSVEKPWELVDMPDVQGIDQFWTGVEQDIAKDPEWFSFAED